MATFGVGLPGPVGAVPSELVRAGVANAGRLGGRSGDRDIVSSGWPALDRLLAGGGVRRGGLIEWLAGERGAADAGCGSGAATLACAVACRLAAASRAGSDATGGGLIVVVDRAGWFHPPAVLPWLGTGGSCASRIVVARPSRDDDEIWTVEQSLRCAGVAAVVAWPRLASAWTVECGVAAERGLAGRGGFWRWTTAMRRWQLASRSGGATGLLVRSPTAIGEPSWAESRLAVSALPGSSLLERRLRVARVGGAWCGVEAASGRPADIVLDLARGRPVDERRPAAVAAGGASCRAS